MKQWMLICQCNADQHSIVHCDDDHNWSASTTAYANIEELPTFITRHRQTTQLHQYITTADPFKLQGKQLTTYNLVKDHMESNNPTPLRMVISSTAGTGTFTVSDCSSKIRSMLLHQWEWQHSMLMVTLSTH